MKITLRFIPWLIMFCIAFLNVFQNSAFSQTPKPNIIFITLDDCNDYVNGFDGSSQVKTPNITALANAGTLFYNAYNSAPKCAPSRTSFYLGKDPDYTKIYHNLDIKCNISIEANMIAQGVSTFYTLPGVLKDSSDYFTYSISKNMHCFKKGFAYDDVTPDACSKGESWNKITLFEETGDEIEILELGTLLNAGVPDFNFAAIPDSMEVKTQDYLSTDSAISFLNQYAEDNSIACNKPFFMAVGYRRPHGPLYVPEKYFPKTYNVNYEESDFQINYDSLPDVPPNKGVIMPPQPDDEWSDFYALPENGVAWAFARNSNVHDAVFIKVDKLIDAGILPEFSGGLSTAARRELLLETYRANMVMAYMAAIQFVDAQVGRLMEELNAHPEIKENTIIVVLSDHGYSLGEKTHWKKGALWETDIRNPLIIVDFRNPEKQRCLRNVSLLDLFPTMLAMSETPIPRMPDGTPYLDGFSLVPLLNNPKLNWERPILSTYKNGIDPNDEGSCFPSYSVRTSEWHYIQYHTNGGEGVCDETNSEIQEELYRIGKRREIDPYEWDNLADNPSYENVKNKLKKYLPDGVSFLDFARESFDAPVAEEAVETKITITPNPADDFIHIYTQGLNAQLPYEISISNLNGTVVQKEYYNASNNFVTQDLVILDHNNIPNGIYIVCLKQGDFSIYEKLVVIK